jgi:hypothetical protein
MPSGAQAATAVAVAEELIFGSFAVFPASFAESAGEGLVDGLGEGVGVGAGLDHAAP